MQPSPVSTAYGKVRGVRTATAHVFRGIPYAAPPARFTAPAPPAPWAGVLDATAFGPTAPKHPYAPPLAALLHDPDIPGDNCLSLNVWTPDPNTPGLPVMVWIHGGSFCHGSSAQAVYDGAAFARDGVVLVSVNYRLGMEGFAALPDAPANLGLRDQLAALAWVRDNIAAFGGDPGNVTVFGESAGAISIAALLTAPRAAGLFRRAIVQSGAPMAVTPDTARRTSRAVAKRLGVAPTAAALRDVPGERLIAAQADVLAGGNPIAGGPGFHVVVDGDVVPRHPAETLPHPGVDLLMGTTTEEYRLWFVPGGVIERISPLLLRLAMLRKRIPRAALPLYRATRPHARPGELLGALATDLLLRVPQNRLADARVAAPGGTYLYEFAWPTPVQDLRACHALELGFVFDTLASADVRALTGPHAPQPLADAMHAAWVSFARDGDPGWPRWSRARPVMTYDGEGGRVVLAPREAERRIVSDSFKTRLPTGS